MPAHPASLFMQEQIPFHRWLGLRVEPTDSDRAAFRLPWRDELTGNPLRPAVHGGVLATLADTAAVTAVLIALADDRGQPTAGDQLSTVDLRIDYLRASHGRDLVAAAEVVRAGGRIAVAKVAIHEDGLPAAGAGDPIAIAHSVFAVQRPKSAD